jgi:hypothetical protein
MAAKRLEIHPEALQEFKVAIVWYRDRSEKAAENLVAESTRPWNCCSTHLKDVQYSIFQLGGLGCDGFPSPLSTTRETRWFKILAVAHGHRRPGYWKNRL